METQEQWRR